MTDREIVTPTKHDNFQLVLLTTLECNCHCEHCYVANAPRQLHGKMQVQEMVNYVEAAANCGASSLCISGGEPFLMLKELYEPIFVAQQFNMQVVLRTNGFWATTKVVTHRSLRKLRWLGLTQLGLSYDNFHSPFIHLSNIKRIVEVCKDLEIPVWIDWCGQERNADIYSLLGRDTFLKLRDCRSAYIVRLGRARSLPSECFNIYPTESLEYDYPVSIQCDGVNGTTLSIYPNQFAIIHGNCCWIHPRLLHKIPSCPDWIDRLFELDRDDIATQLLSNEGVGGLIRIARKTVPHLLDKSGYSDPCELCVGLLGKLFPTKVRTGRISKARL